MPKPDDFDPRATARRLLREARTAALATVARRTGHPFGSLVSIACEADGTPILLMSTLAAHSRNLAEDPRASLLVTEAGAPDPQKAGRLTVLGRVERIAAPEAAARRYLARHPDAALYAGFGDFAWFRLAIEEAHLVGGFARAFHVRRDDLLLDVSACADLVAAEPELIDALAADRDRLARLAAADGAPAYAWTAIGLDPEGLDLAAEVGETRAFHRLVLAEDMASRDDFLTILRSREQTLPVQ